MTVSAMRYRTPPRKYADIIERAAHKKEIFRYKHAEHFQRALRDSASTDELLNEGAAELKTIIFKFQEKQSAQ